MESAKNLAISLLAQNNNTINLRPTGDNLAGRVSGLTIGAIIGGLLRLILVIAAVVFFFVLVIGGVRWILSGGDKGQTEQARSQITAALVGLVIVFAAWAIAGLIGTFFGIGNIFELQIPSIQ
jgi:cbb3-type cytochrome oxidase subunit 3